MASRRMFSKSIVCSDRFLDMPVAARELYFQLGMETDDDGFVGNPRSLTRLCGATASDLETLVSSGFIEMFESGVVHIADFSTSNSIRKDRYHPTVYQDEMRLLNSSDTQVATNPQPKDNQVVATSETEVRLGKDRLGKPKEGAAKRQRFTPPTLAEVKAYCEERGCAIDPQCFIDYYTSNGWKVGRNSMKDWRATIRMWASRDRRSIGKVSEEVSEYGDDF